MSAKIDTRTHLAPLPADFSRMLDEAFADHPERDHSIPSPFSVCPTEQQIKHVIVEFALVPDINSDGESSSIVVEHIARAVLKAWKESSTYAHPHAMPPPEIKIATTREKGRGFYASIDLSAGQTLLHEEPTLQLPLADSRQAARAIFLYPKACIWKVLHLSMLPRQGRPLSPIPRAANARLVDVVSRILACNSFGVLPGVFSIQQYGSLFNHARFPNTANVDYDLEEVPDGNFSTVFKTIRPVRANQELLIDYAATSTLHANGLERYGYRWGLESQLRDQYGIPR